MAEEMKQRFNAKAEIGIDEIEDDDIGIMTHRPNVLEGGDRKWKFGTLLNWIKRKLSEIFATKEELNVNLGEKQDDYTMAGSNTQGSADCNDFYNPTKTTHFFARAPINGPKTSDNGDWIWFETIPFYKDGFATQTAKSLIDNKTYQRRLYTNSWSDWQELATMDKTVRYSTTETPIGTWIDGKTLYRRVIETTAPSAETRTINGFKEKNIDFFKNGETHIVNLTGVIWSGSNDMPIPYIAEAEGSDWGSLYTRISQQQIVIHFGKGADSHFGKPMKIIVEYIK